jgi:DNA (cytosine-5)-methyltransferase 1
MKTGSLCTGYAGLDMAVHEVLGGELAWVADNDPDKSAILAYRFPGVPNLGDFGAVDWSAVEPVDVLTAGFPCKDISCAGQQAGLRKGNRSGVWYHVARAIAELRPPLVIIENVKELLSVGADSDVEPCPWCMGDTSAESAMRALGAVLADLAEIGFDAEWVSVPAASAGACHLRWRVFILAWPAADTAGHQPRRHEPVTCNGTGDARDGSGTGYRIAAADAESIGEREPADEAHAITGSRGPRAVPGGGSARAAADTDHGGRRGGGT